jgi:hypothetical protein
MVVASLRCHAFIETPRFAFDAHETPEINLPTSSGSIDCGAKMRHVPSVPISTEAKMN